MVEANPKQPNGRRKQLNFVVGTTLTFLAISLALSFGPQALPADWRTSPSTWLAFASCILSLFWAVLAWHLERIHSEIRTYSEAIHSGLAKHGNNAIRLLPYDEEQGTLKNTTEGEDSPRNVLFNLRTIQTVLRGVIDHGDEAHLTEIGRICGENFSLRVLLSPERKPHVDDLGRLIDDWFLYDSNAGFGKFWRSTIASDGKLKITLQYNFLTAGDELNHTNHKNLCAFMSGYIKGVVSRLPPETLRRSGFNPQKLAVDHAERDCTWTWKDERKGCVFTVTSGDD